MAEQELGKSQAHRVCFIDDSRTSAFVTKKLLKQFGYEVDHFPAAESAIDAIMERDYAALITDLMISSDGGVNGDDLIRLVRNCGHPTKSKIPILVVTGLANADSHQELVATGANAVLLKPLDGPELDRALRLAIEKSKKTGAASVPRVRSPNVAVPIKLSATYFAEMPVEPETAPPAIEPVVVAHMPSIAPLEVSAAIPTLTQAVGRVQPKTPAGRSEVTTAQPKDFQDVPSEFGNLTLQQIAAQSDASAAKEQVASSAKKPRQAAPSSGRLNLDDANATIEAALAGAVQAPRRSVPQNPAPAIPEVAQAKESEAAPAAKPTKRDRGDDALLALLNQIDEKKLKGGSDSAGSPFVSPRQPVHFSPRARKAVGAVALLALLVPATYFVINREQVPEITLAEVAQGPVSQSIRAAGRVVSRRKVSITAFFAGQVAKVNVKEGDAVKKGDVLIRLDDREAVGNVKRAEAMLMSTQETVAQTSKTLERLQKALDMGAVSRKSVEDAEAEWKTSSAQQSVMEEDLRAAKLALERMDVTAQFDGVVTHITALVGQWVNPPEPILTLVDSGQREVEITLGTGDAGRIRTGQTLAMSSAVFPDKSWQGEVLRVADSGRVSGENSATVYAGLGNDAPALKLGQNVDVEIQSASDDKALNIPIEALFNRNGQRTVAVARNGQVHFIPVTVGIENQTQAEIVQGLAMGQKIIIPGANQLAEGQKVPLSGG